jgi:hypothetical protein
MALDRVPGLSWNKVDSDSSDEDRDIENNFYRFQAGIDNDDNVILTSEQDRFGFTIP